MSIDATATHGSAMEVPARMRAIITATLVILAACSGESPDTLTGPAGTAPIALAKGGTPGPPTGGGSADVTPVALAHLYKRGLSNAQGINGAGVVAGSSEDENGTFRPVLWLPAGSGWGAPQQLSSGDGDGAALAINENGFVAGSVIQNGQQIAAIWRPDGSRVDLGPGQAKDINAGNTAVGSATGIGAVVWRYDVSTDGWRIEALPQGAGGIVLGISDDDVAVGFGGPPDHAIAWEYHGGAWSDPTPLPQTGFAGSSARRASGAIVGGVWLNLDGCAFAAAVWSSASAEPLLIPGLSGARSEGSDVAPGGELVGEDWDSCIGGVRAFWWSPADGLRWLLPLRKNENTHPNAISSTGLVAGVSEGAAARRAVVWRIP